MKRYGEILRVPGLIAVVLSQLIARFPGGMLALAILIHLQRQTGNFTVPGLVLAALSFGQAIASPVTSRLMSQFGIRTVVGTVLTACTITITIIALVPLDTVPAIVLGFIIGVTLAPIQPAARAVYPTLVSREQLQSLQSLDASIQEVIWIGGPVIVVALATQVNSSAAVLAAALFGLLGGIWFLSRPEVARAQLERSTGRMGAVLKKPAVMIVVVTGLLVVGSFGSIEAATVSAFGSGPDSAAGIVLALWAATSLIGGLAMGHTPMGPWSLSRRLAFVALGTALAMFTLDPVLITFALLLSGFGVAPAMTVQYAIATESVEKGDIPESLGWLGTGWVMGGALASAVAGIAIDTWGTAGGFAIGTAFAILAMIVPAIWVRKLPDLRHLHH
jgi:MFS family permease